MAVPHATRFVDPRAIDGVEDLRAARIGPLAPRRHDAADPGHELATRRHLSAQIRQLEVRVRVDQAGQHRDVAEVDDLRAVGGTRFPRAERRRRGRASTATQPSRIGGSPIGRIQAA